MVFSSLIFIFLYLTVTLVLYYLSPRKWRNFILFAMSLIFYGWGEPKFILLMVLSICSAYGFGFAIEKNRGTNPTKAKLWLSLSLIVSLSSLLFFKYYNFFASQVGLGVIRNLTLPVGISFYTFQIMSYSIDLYRGDVSLERSLISFGTYVTLFPQLIAGPIVRYQDVSDRLRQRKETLSDFSDGVQRFVIGLSKKLILGDAAAAAAKMLETAGEFSPTVIGTWLIMLFYSLHIYFDFSGYSDMAIGLGKMFGFRFPENFNYPYTANSITDFWRRWHITLSTWFKEYVYIPLGGNRKGKYRTLLNMAVVWFLTGFWHGADWNYLLWGVYFWIFLLAEKLFLLKPLGKHPILSRVYAMLVIGFGWMIFFHSDLGQLLHLGKHLIGLGADFASPTLWYDLWRLLPFALICAVACTPYPKIALDSLCRRVPALRILRPVGTAILLLLSVAYMVDSSFSPFLYYIF